MTPRFRQAVLALVTLGAWAAGAEAADQNLNEANEKAMKAAVVRVAPCVVQVETIGGTELIGEGAGGPVRKGVGPTTGVIVSPDGYIISSAFNFAHKPSAIFVSVPGKGRLVAKAVATDHTRMLTLLKVDATGLPVPVAGPKADLQVGQWSLALGRALNGTDAPPSVSSGIISALGRVWGRAIQTDAKTSPVNYGGPLIDVQGRVQGIIVPLSPRGEGETAGVEWYDSGIGFAVPMEDVNRVLPKLREGKDLRKGVLGITTPNKDPYGEMPAITSVAPESPAAKAGIKTGDVLVEIDGKRIETQTQMQHALGPKYEGDTVSLKVRRGKDEVSIPSLTLMGPVTAVVPPFLGVLPMRDDPDAGVLVRFVYPKSPAEAAGIKVGDRIVKIAPASVPELRPVPGRDELVTMIDGLTPGTELKLELRRKEGGKVETVTAKLATVPDEVPAKLPDESTLKKALTPKAPVEAEAPMPGLRPRPMPPVPPKEEKKEENAEGKKPDKKSETGLLKRKDPILGREYWVFVPRNYDPNVSHGLVIWLHAAGKGGKDAEDLVDIWQGACEDQHLILVGPKSENETGWVASETEQILEAAKTVIGEYTVDRQRVVAHGMGIGGQMAFYLGFAARDTVRGVATTGAALASAPKDGDAQHRLSFFVVAGGKDPLAKEIAAAKAPLTEKKYPTVFREVAEMGKEYLDLRAFLEVVRWIDSLDRI
jgi:S1-C subfamily serine protease/predicted esterase